MTKGVVLLDFDGTLAHRPGMWSQCVLDVLDVFSPGHEFALDHIRPYLRDGFPWHRHAVPHPHLAEPEEWWAHVGTLLAEAFRSTGIAQAVVAQAVDAARAHYCDPTRFQVFPDTVPALKRLQDADWTTVVLSNHVPELAQIVDGVGLSPLIDRVISSATTGYEKPHPEMFRIGLADADPADAWMVGDNVEADVQGAEAVRIRAILVRRRNASVLRQADTLTAAAAAILAS